MRNPVIVVGGGLAGLAAATWLGRAGSPVTLYEMGKEAGGRARTTRAGEYLINMGPHALYRGGAGAKVLKELGIKYSGHSPKVNGWAVLAGRSYRFPSGPTSLLSTDLLTAGGKLEIVRLLARLPFIDTGKLEGISFSEWLDREIRSPEVRNYLEALNRVATYTNMPHLQSASAFVRQVQQATKNVLYLDGGWQSLVDGLRQAAQAAGVKIITGTRVAGLEIDGRVKAVRLDDGTTQPASAVILALDPANANRLLGNRQAGDWAATLTPVRMASLDLALRRLPQPDRLFALGIDRPLYLSVHSAYARLGAGDGLVMHVAKYLPPDYTEPAADRQELEQLLDLVQPGWRAEVVEQRFLPNMTVSYGVVSAARGGFAGRPGVRLAGEGLDNVFLAGDWVGPEGLLSDAAFSSAMQAARLARGSAREAGQDLELAGDVARIS